MSNNAVVVVDDSNAGCGEIVDWLRAHDVDAHGASNTSVMHLIEGVRARVVICRPGSTGIALFHALQEAIEPPMVVLLSDSPGAKDEIYSNGRLLVAVVRMPVQMASLAQFVKAALGATSRLDIAALAALLAPPADIPPARETVVPLRLPVAH
jgi:DNA-binding NtrC family response regulator